VKTKTLFFVYRSVIPAFSAGIFLILRGMKKRFFLLFLPFLLFLATAAIGQAPPQSPFSEHYFYLTSHARWLKEQRVFTASAETYDSAFQAAGDKGRPQDYYDAACACALAGNADKAFFYLDKLAREAKFSDPDGTSSDEDLFGLHTDKRWQNMLDRMKVNLLAKEGKFDKALEDTLNRVYTDDQSPRLAIDSVQRRFGRESHQMDSLWDVINIKDSVDLVIVESVLRRHGWLGPDEVGGRASMALFLVIQHSDLETQQAWVPAMRAAVQQGKAKPENLALLEDRILTEQGKPQIYGSQVHTDVKGNPSFFPILDEANVNKRRATVGLGPLEEYARYFGIDYHLPSPAH
jgi:hypothetical protein